VTDARTMVNFRVGTRLFNYRAAGIAIRDGHVLICHEDDDDYVMLPGGRVEIGEASDVALAREIAEELRSPAALGRLIFTVEISSSTMGRRSTRSAPTTLSNCRRTFRSNEAGWFARSRRMGICCGSNGCRLRG
jgi:8-oxo-dGTP pyrophosphatase MutT (NUDIX family)